ncbi:hypothetical protein BJX63DRAFT_377203 [Aspergillus granulosus]|uniref:Uncharacterized protein n=1 Tax=Aspergillus granulosus TaxID=176169 RepID=A0ABR4I4J0_9EURO
MFDDVLIAGNLDRVQTLLRKCPPPWPQAHINSLLWQAAAQAPKYEHRQCNLIMQLARTGSSALTFSDSGGWSALHYLCSVRPTGSAAARDMIQLLINEGMPLNGKNHAGLTPLHRAIYTKNRVPIQLLLRACCTRQGRANIPDFEPAIDSLMKLEVNVSSLVMDRDGFTAIDRAVIKFKDEKVRTVFGALLGWPDDN